MAYAIEELSTGDRIRRFGSLPKSFDIGNKRIVSPVSVGDEGLGYRMIELVEVGFSKPGPYYSAVVPDTEDRVGDVVTITRTWNAWTQQEIDDYEAARTEQTATQFDNVDTLVRAAVLIIMDELNTHSTRLKAVLDAASAATSLDTFKSNMAAISPIAQRTPAQLRSAIVNKLGS